MCVCVQSELAVICSDFLQSGDDRTNLAGPLSAAQTGRNSNQKSGLLFYVTCNEVRMEIYCHTHSPPFNF